MCPWKSLIMSNFHGVSARNPCQYSLKLRIGKVRGLQERYTHVTAEQIRHIQQAFPLQAPQIVYRYCEARAENARAIIRKHAQQFLDYHGTDLVSYPAGKAMAADLHTFHQYQFASAPKEDVEAFLTKHQLSEPSPHV